MARSQGNAEARQAEIAAVHAQTRANQTDTVARQGLNSELGTMRAALGGNQDRPSVGTLEVMNELRRTRERERRIGTGNQMQDVYDARMAAANARYGGRMGLLSGVIQAAPSIFQLQQDMKGPS